MDPVQDCEPFYCPVIVDDLFYRFFIEKKEVDRKKNNNNNRNVTEIETAN